MALPLCVGRALRENSQSPSSIVAASNAAQACWRRRSVYQFGLVLKIIILKI